LAKDMTKKSTQGSAFRAGPPRERTPLRDNLESIVFAIIMVLVLRQMVVEAFRIQHGSMAPTLLGDHREVRCPDCSYTFDVGLDKSTAEGMVKCPNGGYEWPGLSRDDARGRPYIFRWPAWLWNSASVEGGGTIRGPTMANRVPRGPDRIFVNKLLYSLRKPRRWEVVVFIFPYYDAFCPISGWRGQVYQDRIKGFRDPDSGSKDVIFTARNYIKRIVGLPGETVQVLDGDVYINGKIARKPADVQAQIWMHVFDSFYMPRHPVERLWDLSADAGRWKVKPAGGVLEVDARGARAPVLGAYAPAITDYYPYDGTEDSGHNAVGDVRIRARLRALAQDSSDGEAVLSIADKGHVFEFLLGAGNNPRAVLEGDGVPMRQTSLNGQVLARSHWMALENYDDRVVGRLDGRMLFRFDYDAGTDDPRGGPDAVRFGARGAELLFQRIAVDRDVYYTSVPGSATSGYTLESNEYYMLGDNSPISSDSRRWDRPGIPAKNIIGKATCVFWPVYRWKLLATPPQ
jgi:signal peptidase I